METTHDMVIRLLIEEWIAGTETTLERRRLNYTKWYTNYTYKHIIYVHTYVEFTKELVPSTVRFSNKTQSGVRTDKGPQWNTWDRVTAKYIKM